VDERQRFLIKMALRFLSKNLETASEQFEYINDDAFGCVIVDGDIQPEPEPAEIETLLEQFQ